MLFKPQTQTPWLVELHGWSFLEIGSERMYTLPWQVLQNMITYLQMASHVVDGDALDSRDS